MSVNRESLREDQGENNGLTMFRDDLRQYQQQSMVGGVVR